MSNSKSSTHALLAAALMAASGTAAQFIPAALAAPRRSEQEQRMSWEEQRRLREKQRMQNKLTREQWAWNEAVDAKRMAKKGKVK